MMCAHLRSQLGGKRRAMKEAIEQYRADKTKVRKLREEKAAKDA
jgi:hypothetical protein